MQCKQKRESVMLCALVPLEGSEVEVLPPSTSPIDVLDQGPLHSVDCGHGGWKLYWTSGSYHLKEVNELASSLAKQLVKGDACLVHPTSHQHMLERLLQSRQCRRAAGMGHKLNSAFRNIALSNGTQKQQTYLSPQPGCDTHSSSAPLKRARSSQRIAAANTTRQRILSSMGPLQRHLPGQFEANIGLHTGIPLYSNSRPCHDVAKPATASVMPETPPRHERKKSPQRTRGQQHSLGRAYDCSCCNNSSLLCCSTTQDSRSHSSSTRGCMQTAVSASPATPVETRALSVTEPADAAPGEMHIAACSGAIITSLGTSKISCASPSKLSRCDQPALPTGATASTSPPTCPAAAWDELPEDVVGRVAGFLGRHVSAVMPMYSVCRSWQRAVLDNDQLLSNINCRLDSDRPFKPHGSHHPAAAPVAAYQHWQHRAIKHQHPALLERTSRLSNVSALVTRARLLDTAADAAGAMKFWRRAAKCGHVEAQLLSGLAHYRGSAGLPQDPEEAHMWLNKALKQVQKLSSPDSMSRHTHTMSTSASISSVSTNPAWSEPPTAASRSISTSLQTSAASNGSTSRSNCPPTSSDSDHLCDVAMPGNLVARVQAQAGLVLGYLCFDGEGTRSDKQEAVKLFKLAAAAAWGRESREAAQVLGWIWNTGGHMGKENR